MSENEPRKSGKKFFILGTLIFIGGILFAGAFSVALDFTNTTEFCTSCHTMETNLEELKQTGHYKNAYGITVGCADCHVPHSLGPKLWAKLMAAKDVYHEIMGTIDTPEKYEARRWHMANLVWDKMKASDSRECRSCHSLEHMNFEKQHRAGSKQHILQVRKALKDLGLDEETVEKAIETMDFDALPVSENKKLEMKEALTMKTKTCIECHQGVAHTLPKEFF
ncbi:cytochrome C-type protein NapC [Candidatus Thiomargarita nelsonii]|uniref:Cytochrome c-type protein n=1 Tax=Candidatus Thiomargarita nelsonii TaxID=1003181 RepID=A0A176S272_9GAMM|nr:cytochrome C-type protein NapC [Candidatus Thiomargarita nelsonii]